ncbi:MAG: Ig-like domain repeat protein, partial [Candidatus Acidiferrum sp.]
MNNPIAFNNTGTVAASAGTLSFGGGGTCGSTCAGSWTVNSGATLQYSSLTFALSGAISGQGTVNFSGATVTLTGTYPLTGTTNVSAGIVDFDQPYPATITGALNQSAGTLDGTGALTISGLLTWSGGTESGTGTTTANGTTMVNGVATSVVFPAGSDVNLTGRTFINNGLAVWQTGTAGQFVFGSGAQWNNAASSTWNFQNDTSLVNGGGTGQAFNNSGIFEKTGSNSTSTASTVNAPIAFNNAGTATVTAGILGFGGSFTQTAGNTFLNGGNIQTTVPMNIQGGTVTGSGTVTGATSAGGISNANGTLSPGVSAIVGSITLGTGGGGNYSQGATGVYDVKIGGASAGQYDTVTATNNATLAGTLNVTLINGFSPALANSFTILTAGTVSGNFATTNLPTLLSGLGWNVKYNTTSVVLSVVSVATPVATLNTTSLSFPNTIVGSSSAVNTTAKLENSGTAPLTIASIIPTGADAGNYSYTTDATSPCPISPNTLGNGSSCTLEITFTPTSAGTHNNAQITITDNNGSVMGSTQTINLSGTGIQLSSIAVTPNPATTQMGNKIPFTATGTYTDNSTQNLTSAVTWNSSSMTVATIATAGLASALTGGTTNITASQTIFGGSVITSPIDVFTVTAATHFAVSAQSTATEGTAFNFSVTALDQNNITVPGYAGTAHFTSTDPLAVLPANTTLTNGSGTFSATLKTAGSQTITATDTVTSTITGTSNVITVGSGTPASVTATAGATQSAAINTAFGTALQATVKDNGGNLLSGVSVVFTAPGTGASGTFANGTATTTSITNSSGIAVPTTFTANGTAGGPYTVTATVAGVTGAADYSLTNTAGTPASVTATAGGTQSAAINTAFGTLLAATVKDSGGNLLPGVSVVFTAPGTGASGTFANGTATTTAITNGSGVATATVFTANATAGGPYTVTGTVAGVTGAADYSLTNTAGTPASVTATAGATQSVAINTAFGTLLAATVKDSGGNLLPGVNVAFTAPGTGASGTFANGTATMTTKTSSSGIATSTVFTANATAGGYTVTASVAGVATGAGFSLTNTAGGTTTAVTSSTNPSTVNQSVTFRATVVPVAPATGTPTGTVSFTSNGAAIAGCASVALSGTDVATCATSALAAGSDSIVATYGGDSNFNGSSGSLTQTVNNESATTTAVTSSANPSVVNQAVTLTATVSGAGGTPTGTVLFTANGTGISGCGSVELSVATGVARCTASALAVGSDSIVATYGGDSNFNGSSGTLTQTVNKGATTTAVTSSANPSVVDQTVNLTATVAPVAPATGTLSGKVSFSANGTTITGCGAVAVTTTGVATCTTSTLAVGSDSIVATYGNDSNFSGSSGTLTQTVNKGATTTAVTSSANPSVVDQTVNLTATVAPVAPATGTLSGNVSFSANGTTITGCGAVAVTTAGVATCTTSTLAVGSDSIVATYGNDSNFSGSSGTLTQVVSAALTI